MDNYIEYDAQAGTIKLEDITPDEDNQRILRRLKRHSWCSKLSVCGEEDYEDGESDYCPGGARDLGWLGYYIGNSKHLKELHLRYNDALNANLGIFCRGIGNNRSIQKFGVEGMNLSDGVAFEMMDPFFKNNNNLTDISVTHCELGAKGCRSLSLALAGCKSKSLKRIRLGNNEFNDDQLADVIVALSMHSQLEEVDFYHNNIGRNGCLALSTLMQWTTTKVQSIRLRRNGIGDNGVSALVVGLSSCKMLRTLHLGSNGIGDEGVNALARALVNNSHLQKLNLSGNPITNKGWLSLSSLLQAPNSNLEELVLNVHDEGDLIFANALVNNRKLKKLMFWGVGGFTSEVWSSFSKILCDTSSVNKTFLSNHTLEEVFIFRGVPSEVSSTLRLNSNTNKKHVAITKILGNHRHFNMHPFFEWDFKVLPLAIDWFKRALLGTKLRRETPEHSSVGSIKRRKLSSIYQFVGGMPVLYIKSRMSSELSEVRASEMKLEREQLKLQRKQLELSLELKEIKRRKNAIANRL